MNRAFPFLLLVLAVLLLAAPFSGVLAQTSFTGPIVPCGNPGQPSCQACHLVELAQNVVNFFVYASVVLATLTFTWAGLLYVTSGAKPGNIEAAHKIFWTVLWGLIIVLSSWLIVDTIMKAFLNQRFGPWNRIDCSGAQAAIRSFRPTANPELGGSDSRRNQLEVVAPSRPLDTADPGVPKDSLEEILRRDEAAGP